MNLNFAVNLQEVRKKQTKPLPLVRYLDKEFLSTSKTFNLQSNTCSLIDQKSKPLYSDDNHITDYANSEYIFPDFVSFLRVKQLLNEDNQKLSKKHVLTEHH